MKPKKDEPAHWEIIRRTTGANIRELRIKAHLSQEDLAEKSNLSRNTIIRAEWGKISLTIERLTDIAIALNIDVAELVTRVPQDIDFKLVKWADGRSRARTGKIAFAEDTSTVGTSQWLSKL